MQEPRWQASARRIALVCALAAVCPAAEMVGQASSSGDFYVSGRRVNLAGQPSWPVREGDVVSTGAAPARVKMTDGSELLLNANSSFRVAREQDGLFVRFLNGELAYRLSEPMVGVPQEGVLAGTEAAPRFSPASFQNSASVNTNSAFRDPLAASEVVIPRGPEVIIPVNLVTPLPTGTGGGTPTGSLLNQTLGGQNVITPIIVSTGGGFSRLQLRRFAPTAAPPAITRQAQTEKKEK